MTHCWSLACYFRRQKEQCCTQTLPRKSRQQQLIQLLASLQICWLAWTLEDDPRCSCSILVQPTVTWTESSFNEIIFEEVPSSRQILSGSQSDDYYNRIHFLHHHCENHIFEAWSHPSPCWSSFDFDFRTSRHNFWWSCGHHFWRTLVDESSTACLTHWSALHAEETDW